MPYSGFCEGGSCLGAAVFMSSTDFKGADKAAVFLLSIGPKLAGPIMKKIDDQSLVEIARRMPGLGKIPPEKVMEIYAEFQQLRQSGHPVVATSIEDVAEILKGVVDEERLEYIMKSLESDAPVKTPVWSKLSRMKPKAVFVLIRNENPQTIAIILGRLEPEMASKLLEMLPDKTQMSVVFRMSKIESVSADLVHDIEDALEKGLTEAHGSSGLTFDGMVKVVDILKTLDGRISKPILEYLKEKDQELFEQVDGQLLVFEELGSLTGRDIQSILKHVSSDDLIKALKGATDEMRELFFGNMSQRAADIMREDIEVMGPIKVSEVEQSQRAILEISRKLGEDGTISLGGQEEMVG